MKILSLYLSIALAVLMFAGGAFAQNSASTYDVASSITKTGVVTDLRWTNPRCFVSLDVKGEDGTVVNWSIELTNPRTLIRFGVVPAIMPEGKEVTVTFNPSKNQANRGRVKQLKIDGKLVFDMEKAVSDGGLLISSRDSTPVVIAASGSDSR